MLVLPDAKPLKQMKVGGTEILKMTGASKTQLNYWVRSRAVIPEVNAIGSGRRRVYNSRNIVEVAICVALNKFGLAPTFMEYVLAGLRMPGIVTGDTNLDYWEHSQIYTNLCYIIIITIDEQGEYQVFYDVKNNIDAMSFTPARTAGVTLIVDLYHIEKRLGLR